MIGLACVLPLLVGAVLLGAGTELSGRVASRVGLAGSLVTAALVAVAWGSGAVIDIPWLPALDLRVHLALDGISGPLALLAAGVTAAACSTVLADTPRGGSAATFVGALLITLAGAVGTFAARDALLFVVAFELVLVPMWVLITRFGDDRDPAARREAGARFVLYTGLGSTLMLLGVLLLVSRAGTGDLVALGAGRGQGLGTGVQVTVAVLLTLGLAIKVPVWPLHSWLPMAHTTAPTAGSMVLAAVLLKMGTYGLVRLPLATVPEGFARVAPVLAVCGTVGIIWGGLVCLVERELKRLIAWSSIAHMGFVALALATGSATGVAAALYANLAHGVISALLFLVVGGLKHRWGDDGLGTARSPFASRRRSPGCCCSPDWPPGSGCRGSRASGARPSRSWPRCHRPTGARSRSSSAVPSSPPSAQPLPPPTRCGSPGSSGSARAATTPIDPRRAAQSSPAASSSPARSSRWSSSPSASPPVSSSP